MNEPLTIPFVSEDAVSSITGRGNKWAILEQKYKTESEREANIYDVQQMLALAKIGTSPYKYISDECPYISADGEAITIELDFYVWVSALDLPYDLTTEFGTISIKTLETQSVEFDLIFNGSDYEEMNYIFSGTFTPQMPIITPDGDKIPTMPIVPEGSSISSPHMIVEDSSVSLSEVVYTVFRARGTKKGYKHTITMVLNKETGYKIENIKNSITLKYVDDNGDEKLEHLELEIPKCVEELLETCPGDADTPKYILVIDSNDSNKTYKVYVNTCDGSIITRRWEKKLRTVR